MAIFALCASAQGASPTKQEIDERCSTLQNNINLLRSKLVDIKNAVYKYYVDGQFVKEFTTEYFGVSGCVIQMSNIIDYFDTFTIMYYPNGVVNDSNIIAVSAAQRHQPGRA